MSADGCRSAWWDERPMSAGGLAYRIGPLRLFVHRLDGEWQLAHEQVSAEDACVEGWSVEEIDGIPPELGSMRRFASGEGEEEVLRLRPRPADRSMVARPRAPLHVLPGAQSRFYVSAPVWLELCVGREQRALCEVATKRLSDTWFGSSTRDGEVAYALKTQARTRLAEIPQLAYRAVTPVLISNHGEDLLALERMNLPLPHLSIYTCARGNLWTEAIHLLRGEDSEMANFEVASGPPDEASGAERIGEARVEAAGNPLVRAFGRLLSPFQGES